MRSRMTPLRFSFFTLGIIYFTCLLSTCLSQAQGDPRYCNEYVVANITNFYQCAKYRCLVNWNARPWVCRTFEVIPQKFTEELVQESVDENDEFTVGCNSNTDCGIVNAKYNWRCCSEGYCSGDNLDEEAGSNTRSSQGTAANLKNQWLAVNREWYTDRSNAYCSTFYKKYCDAKTLGSNERCKRETGDDPETLMYTYANAKYYAMCEKKIHGFTDKAKPSLYSGTCKLVQYGTFSWKSGALAVGLCVMALGVIIGYLGFSDIWKITREARNITPDGEWLPVNDSSTTGEQLEQSDDEDENSETEDAQSEESALPKLQTEEKQSEVEC